jgi:hypothetical protein
MHEVISEDILPNIFLKKNNSALSKELLIKLFKKQIY